MDVLQWDKDKTTPFAHLKTADGCRNGTDRWAKTGGTHTDPSNRKKTLPHFYLGLTDGWKIWTRRIRILLKPGQLVLAKQSSQQNMNWKSAHQQFIKSYSDICFCLLLHFWESCRPPNNPVPSGWQPSLSLLPRKLSSQWWLQPCLQPVETRRHGGAKLLFSLNKQELTKESQVWR